MCACVCAYFEINESLLYWIKSKKCNIIIRIYDALLILYGANQALQLQFLINVKSKKKNNNKRLLIIYEQSNSHDRDDEAVEVCSDPQEISTGIHPLERFQLQLCRRPFHPLHSQRFCARVHRKRMWPSRLLSTLRHQDLHTTSQLSKSANAPKVRAMPGYEIFGMRRTDPAAIGAPTVSVGGTLRR